MSTTRTWAGGAAALSVLLVIAAWFMLISPKRGQAAELRQQRVSQLAANSQLSLEIAQLRAQYASLPAKQAELAVIQRQMPNNPQLPTLIRTLVSLASQAGVSLQSITPGQPAAVATPSAGSGTGGSTGTGAATAATSAGGANIMAISLSLSTSGTYAQNELFLQKLQTGMTRALLVQSLSLAPGGAASTTSAGATNTSTGTAADAMTLTTTGEVFMLQGATATTSTSGTAAKGSSTTGAAGSSTAKTSGTPN